jgi:hypothetical protein
MVAPQSFLTADPVLQQPNETGRGAGLSNMFAPAEHTRELLTKLHELAPRVFNPDVNFSSFKNFSDALQ